MIRSSFSRILGTLILSINLFNGFGPLEEQAFAGWNWKETPSEKDWERFQILKDEDRAKLWKSLEQQKLNLEDLSWEWRLGWVRACSKSQETWCAILLQYGLFDKALVVRAESASILGRRFEGTGHGPALRLLETAYRVQQNNRHKEPLFIQYRILEAIRQIGGPKGSSLGTKLAQSSESTARYWQIIKE